MSAHRAGGPPLQRGSSVVALLARNDGGSNTLQVPRLALNVLGDALLRIPQPGPPRAVRFCGEEGPDAAATSAVVRAVVRP